MRSALLPSATRTPQHHLTRDASADGFVQHHEIVLGEAEGHGLAALRQLEAWIVECVERDAVLLDPDPDTNHRTKKTDLLDRSPQVVAPLHPAIEHDGLRPERQCAGIARLGAG